MRIKCSLSWAITLVGILLANIAVAHPGHGPGDLAAQVSQPLAGVDHFVAFLALTSVLLLALRMILKCRRAKLRSILQRVRKNGLASR